MELFPWLDFMSNTWDANPNGWMLMVLTTTYFDMAYMVIVAL